MKVNPWVLGWFSGLQSCNISKTSTNNFITTDVVYIQYAIMLEAMLLYSYSISTHAYILVIMHLQITSMCNRYNLEYQNLFL